MVTGLLPFIDDTILSLLLTKFFSVHKCSAKSPWSRERGTWSSRGVKHETVWAVFVDPFLTQVVYGTDFFSFSFRPSRFKGTSLLWVGDRAPDRVRLSYVFVPLWSGSVTTVGVFLRARPKRSDVRRTRGGGSTPVPRRGGPLQGVTSGSECSDCSRPVPHFSSLPSVYGVPGKVVEGVVGRPGR